MTGNDSDCRIDYSTNVTAACCVNINSIVYYFPSVKICNERYCYATAPKPSGANGSSITGHEPCQQTCRFILFLMLNPRNKIYRFFIKSSI